VDVPVQYFQSVIAIELAVAGALRPAEGGPGNDHLAGGRGRDRLDGGGGSDFLIAKDAGRGNDVVVGGPGRDRCRTDFIHVCP